MEEKVRALRIGIVLSIVSLLASIVVERCCLWTRGNRHHSEAYGGQS